MEAGDVLKKAEDLRGSTNFIHLKKKNSKAKSQGCDEN